MDLNKKSEECKKIIRKTFPNYKSKEEKFEEILKSYLRKDSYVLDAGCGKGSRINFTNYVRLAVGIDRFEENLRENYKVHTRIVADIEKSIPLRESIFDIVVCEMVLEHLKNPLSFFRELSRVLKERGVFILITPNILSFWIISKLTPFKLHQILNKRLHNIDDTFPTYYRANTVSRLNNMLRSADLMNERTIMFENKPSMLVFSKFLTRLGIIYAKILRKYQWLQPIREIIIASYRKV